MAITFLPHDSSGMVSSILIALAIFACRVCDMSLDTLRVVSLVKGNAVRAAILGFCEALIFITAISQVLRPPFCLLYMLAYASGFGGGTLAGTVIAGVVASQFVLLRVLSRDHASDIINAFRREGFRVTVVQGEGQLGPVPILFSVMERRICKRAIELVRRLDEKAFVLVEPVEEAVGGYVPRLARLRPSVRY